MQSANEPAGQVQAGRAEIARLRAGAECVRARGRYRVRGAELSHWRDETERVFGMINHAMQHLPDFRPWPRESLYGLMESLLPVAKGYRWADLSLTSADNPRTPQLAEHLGAVLYKRYRVRRKWLTGVPLDVPVPPTDPEESPGLSPNENPRQVAAYDQAVRAHQ